MRQFTRRRFLYCVGGAASLTGLTAGALLRPTGELQGEPTLAAPTDDHALRIVKRTSWALGSMVSLTVLHHDETRARRAIDSAFAVLEGIEASLSIYRPNSEVSRLNRHRELKDPSPHLLRLLEVAHEMSSLTKGAFDITVQPLWELYADAQKRGRLPTASEVEHAREQVDWKRVKFSSDRVQLDGEGTKITLNGMAQGFAADRVVETLRAHEIEHALIDTGEVSTIGNRSSREAWTVGVQHPRDEDAYVGLAHLAGRCLATSGDYATTFTPDCRHHHLFDPHTGHSPAEFSSVSVVAGTALMADMLSTALFVMGLDDGLQFIRDFPGADALLVLKNGRTVRTDGFPVA